MSAAHSGRHYLQVTDEVNDETLRHSSYFNALKSPRRMKMVEATERQSYQLQDNALSSLGINYLQQFPELDEYKYDQHRHYCYALLQTLDYRKGI